MSQVWDFVEMTFAAVLVLSGALTEPASRAHNGRDARSWVI